MIDASLKHRLRALVGRRVLYRGESCQIIEVLDSEQALVVQCSESAHRTIQGNQFGEATRRVQACHTLPLFGENRELDPDIRDWLDQASP